MKKLDNSNEIVLVMHGPEVAAVWSLLREHLRTSKWDVTDDEKWNTLIFLKSLEKKFEMYLDIPSTGPDVITIGDIKKSQDR